MKPAHQAKGTPKPISIPDDIAARCEGPGQFDKFDHLFRTVIAVPKSAINKDTAKRKRARMKTRRTP